jgi:phage terminase large subunit
VESLKSLDGVSVVFLDEAQTISEESLRVLLPTIREPGSYFLMSANPRSQADPFTQRFFKMAEPLLRSGETFQDDLHTMVLVNIEDNPFAGPELMMERENDKKIMTSAQFAHVWQGHTLDDVENSLIDSDWFESALEIGDKINYRQSGSRVVGFDPSDVGRDASAVAIRHGARVLELALKHEGDVASSLDWSVDFVDRFHADSYIYDGDGIGLGIAREVERALGPRNVNVSAFRGGAGPENPSAMYNDFKTNKDAFNNRRSQAFWSLRERFIKTHQALDGGEYIDPDELIFLPKDHKLIGQLRSEICRLPIKPHPAGKLALMPKPEMARPPLSLPSPNLADSLAYAFSVQDFIQGSWSKPLEYTEAFI